MALAFVHDVFEDIRAGRVFLAKAGFNFGVGRLNVPAQRFYLQFVVGEHTDASPHGFSFRAESAIADKIRQDPVIGVAKGKKSLRVPCDDSFPLICGKIQYFCNTACMSEDDPAEANASDVELQG